MRREFPLWLPSLFWLSLAGCSLWPPEAKPGNPPDGNPPQAVGERETATGKPYTVIAPQTSFFSFGPAQTQGPDFALLKGAPLTLLRWERGFSWVRTANGREGYVATDQIAPLPMEAVAPREKPPESIKKPSKTNEKPEKIKVVPLEQMFEQPALPAH